MGAPESVLLQRLEALAAAGDGPDTPVCIAARRAHGAKSVDIDGPMLGILVSGCKRVAGEGVELAIEAGTAFVIRNGRFDVVNRPPDGGHSQLLRPPPPRLAARIRARVAADPAREWRSLDLELALSLSGATLRRHLAAEGTSLREVVAEARLGCAMKLLYTTAWPVKTVAARVGYRSAATFSRRFAERFGLAPADIGRVGVD